MFIFLFIIFSNIYFLFSNRAPTISLYYSPSLTKQFLFVSIPNVYKTEDREARAVRIRIRKRFINEAQMRVPFACINHHRIRRCSPRSEPQLLRKYFTRVPDSAKSALWRASFSLGTIRETIVWIGGEGGRVSDWLRGRGERRSERFNAGPHLGYLHYVNAWVLHYVSAPRTGVE